MKKIVLISALAVLCCAFQGNAQIKIGGKTLSKKTTNIVKAAASTAQAITLSDAQVMELCRESVLWMDENNPIADESTPWGERLARLTAGIREVNGIPLNFKVYHVIDINAFASGDGSIRVFSSLMDIMTDEELMGIIGHEIGHIANTDVKDAMKTAYLTSAAASAASAAGGKLAKLTESELGEMAQALTGAQFSQKQENAADDFGFQFAIEHGYSPYAMHRSLNKLVELSAGSESSKLQKMFSSHPDSEKRSVRMKEKADNYGK